MDLVTHQHHTEQTHAPLTEQRADSVSKRCFFNRVCQLGRTAVAYRSLFVIACVVFTTVHVDAAPPAPPVSVAAQDHPWDNGTALDVVIELPEQADPKTVQYLVKISRDQIGFYEEVARQSPTELELSDKKMVITAEKRHRGETYYFRVAAINAEQELSTFVETSSAVPTRQGFDGVRMWLGVITASICGAVLLFVVLARSGMPLTIRKIAGLDAIEEAVGRATEMGRSCLYINGLQDINDMQTISGLTILSRVAERAAEYDCSLETPTSRSLVMTAARETVQSAYMTAGRPDAYKEDNIYYVSDEQFAFVSFVTGKMVREKPAACFYMGAFYAESLILAETGNSIGAIQVAGTAEPAQLPFFVAACDYTLIGEEFFAASAYLSKRPDQLGSLKGQDFGKIIAAVLILAGVALVTINQIAPSSMVAHWSHYLLDEVLRS